MRKIRATRTFRAKAMAAYDLEEQDKLNDLKAFWARWGNLISAAVTAVCLVVIGLQAYRWYNKSQAEKASVLYAAVSEVAQAQGDKKDLAKAKEAVAGLVSQFPGTGYAPRAALLLAKQLFEAKDLEGAKSQLSWVITNAKENELKQIARVRAASVALDQKKFDEALGFLDGKFDASMEGLVLDAKGDVFHAAGKMADAKTAYTSALEKLDAKSQARAFTQLKLDTLAVVK
jgi:predicted negative regulator of RcsB-dependent stress response